MATSHRPLEIARSLDSLVREMMRWSRAARTSQQSMEHLQRELSGRASSLRHELSRLEYDLAGICDGIEQLETRAANCESAEQAALSAADEVMLSAEQTSAAAHEAEATWRGHLRAEEQRLTRAQDQLATAESAYQEAEERLMVAQAVLADARAQLAAARNDHHNRGTGGAEVRVNMAQGEVIRCQAQVSAAQAAVGRARNGVSVCEGRVAVCRDALHIAGQAVSEGQHCLSLAREATSEAEGVRSAADEARTSVAALERMRDAADSHLESASTSLSSLVTHVSTAETIVLHAAETHRDVEEQVRAGAQEVEQSIDELRAINRPLGPEPKGARSLGSQGGGRLAGQRTSLPSAHDTGQRGEQHAAAAVKALLGYQRACNVQYSSGKGLDNMLLRQTPCGWSGATVEVKATAAPESGATPGKLLSRLKVDAKGLQQGSRAYGHDRLKTAAERGNRSARMILSRIARTDGSRLWQIRNYVAFANTATGDVAVFRSVSNARGDRVAHLLPVHR